MSKELNPPATKIFPGQNIEYQDNESFGYGKVLDFKNQVALFCNFEHMPSTTVRFSLKF
jgi:hypothetical protein